MSKCKVPALIDSNVRSFTHTQEKNDHSEMGQCLGGLNGCCSASLDIAQMITHTFSAFSWSDGVTFFIFAQNAIPKKWILCA